MHRSYSNSYRKSVLYEGHSELVSDLLISQCDRDCARTKVHRLAREVARRISVEVSKWSQRSLNSHSWYFVGCKAGVNEFYS